MDTHTLGIWIGGILTLCVYSFLYKDNPLYKFAEHLVVGVSVGYGFVLSVKQVFIPYVWDPIVVDHVWITLLPALIGILWFTRFSRRYGWLSRYPIALSMGFGSGMAVPLTMQTRVLVAMRFTMNKLIVVNTEGFQLLETLNAWIIFVGVITVLIYFYFSKEHKGVFGTVAKTGIWFLMVSFGASFGYTVMARISLLIGRLQFILGDWLHIIR